MKEGIFITFEGCEGAGKSTQAKKVFKKLLSKGYDVVFTYEPGGTEIADEIRHILLNKKFSEKMEPKAELLLYFASRAQHIENLILPSLREGKIIICDRFSDATFAYQGYARGLDMEKIMQLNDFSTNGITPNLTILIDIDVEKGLKRGRKRNNGKTLFDRMENEELEFHRKVRLGYLDLAKKYSDRIMVFDGSLSVDALFEKIYGEIENYLAKVEAVK